MKKKILLGIMVVLTTAGMLFTLTGCGNNDVYNQISNALGNVDNLYINPNNPNSNNSTQTTQGAKPKVSIKLIDDKRADFTFDMNSFPEFNFGNDTMFQFFLPEGYEIEYYGERNGLADNTPVHDPELAIVFHTTYAGLGEQQIEKNGSNMIIHVDLSYKDEYQTYVENFSFATMSGNCRLEYMGTNGITHTYEYDYNSILNRSAYTVADIKDKSSLIVGTWWKGEAETILTEPNGEVWGYMVSSFYVFNADGTFKSAYITDYRDANSNYVGVKDEFENWTAGKSFGSRHSYQNAGTYYFDGEIIRFTIDGNMIEGSASIDDNGKLYINIYKDNILHGSFEKYR